MSEHHSWVAAIQHAHTHVALPIESTFTLVFTSDQPVYRVAKEACTALGFIDKDAETIALAWQAMVDRTGQFDPTVWPTDPQDFDIQPWPRENAFAACPRQLGLYAVLPDAAWVGRMARAGVPTVQLRFKSEDPKLIDSEVQAAVQAVQGTGALLFINDHWQSAIRAGAYGVHLGQEDLETADMHAIRESGLRLGLSSHGYAEMLLADRYSPSYIALGAVFPTTLKRMATAPQGVARLRAYAKLMASYPLVAIGGIDASNLSPVLASGVGSVAMVRALVSASNPEVFAAEFQAAIHTASMM
jgi:thiamine-phosphate pyrophosphorylase